MSIIDKIESFSKLKILVVGDVMVDAYYFGTIDRISPEAPVPVISVNKKEHRPGGAANVALNLINLGATVLLSSVIGDDREGIELISQLKKDGINTDGVMVDTHRPTTMKTRVISSKQHLLRIDDESTKDISDTIQHDLLNFITQSIPSIDAIVMEDYNKGLLTEWLIYAIISIANKNNVPTIVDPKKDNFFAYKNCTLFKPNKKEIIEGLKTDLDLSKPANIDLAAQKLIEKLDCKNVMVTLSEDGVFIKNHSQSFHIKAHERKITDVSGAGDTVVSVASLCLASGMSIDQIAEVSNIAGGLVCQKLGVVPVNKTELLSEITRLKL
jgi:rfaE bifunctional protein kinase chain/domain